MPKILIRCGLNKYRTPLFSYDEKGIYVRCKDCRVEDHDGTVHRGSFHLVPWSLVLRYLNESGVAVGSDFLQDNGDTAVKTEPPILLDRTAKVEGDSNDGNAEQ
jgi:hypothetical protein